jgi:hypothetical protein
METGGGGGKGEGRAKEMEDVYRVIVCAGGACVGGAVARWRVGARNGGGGDGASQITSTARGIHGGDDATPAALFRSMFPSYRHPHTHASTPVFS